jgi:hypothetical protein
MESSLERHLTATQLHINLKNDGGDGTGDEGGGNSQSSIIERRAQQQNQL